MSAPTVEQRSTMTTDRLNPIGLEELDLHAALQTRVDRKYLVPTPALDGILRGLLSAEPGVRVLEIDGQRDFGYASQYFDTPDLASFRSAAHRRRRRFKVRTRTYLDSGLCRLEVKTRGSRGTTVKHRTDHDHAPDSLGTGVEFVGEVLRMTRALPVDPRTLEPTLRTEYRRMTLLLPQTASRATIDTHLEWYDGGAHLAVGDVAVVETKSGSQAGTLDRVLWARGIRPARISKFGAGLAALRPELPATRWRRALDHQLDLTWND
ncbi:polyphosphate polymerase domain-containing protein [Paraoerskovia marina]|uniref:polyphosphate polymerase domain-containing protein n=1 Tax=Paraoerskovia marina TaxID=545619 RepID=UPI000AA05B83|nr:polyphosphate polymerase domain-containing protein [Paraoerskovia marina]